MYQYIIYCTKKQITKALELGAPIEVDFQFNFKTAIINNKAYIVPTAEQMINWLENQEDILGVCIRRDYDWFYQISLKDAPHNFSATFHSRKEATLAAIDAALEYLTNNKK